MHNFEILWRAKGIISLDMNLIQFTTTLQGREHSWYRKYDPHQKEVDYDVFCDAFLAEFEHHIHILDFLHHIEFKEIKQGLSKSI